MKLSLENKIAGLVTLPLIAFIILSGVYVYKTWQGYKESQKTLKMTELFHSTAQLMQELQSERSNVGKLLIDVFTSEQLKAERERADKILNALPSQISEVELDENFHSRMQKVKNDLMQIRKAVDTEISGDIFISYNQLIDLLVSFEIDLSRQVTIASVQSNFINVNILEQSREYGAQLQTMLLPILLSNAPLSTTNVARMEKLYSGVIGNLESPLLNVSQDVRLKIQEFQKNEDWQMISLFYDAILAKSTEGQYGMDVNGFMEAMSKAISLLDAPIDTMLNENQSSVEELAKTSLRNLTLISAIILFSILLIFLIVKKFTGNLSKTLVYVAEKLMESSNQVSEASRSVALSSEELARASNEQAISLEKTASSIEQMNSMVGKNSQNAKSTAETSLESKNKADTGKQVVEEMLQSMEEINQSNQQIMDQITASNEQMASIAKLIQEIGDKTKVINDIVFQTKLLSFNASVEAARAGESGKGFAVVAEEVGNLAVMSGNAAKEISDMLNTSIQNVEKIIEETQTKVQSLVNQGKARVESGFVVAKKCSEVLTEIVTNVTDVSSMANEISTASQEQSFGIQEITNAMNQLDSMTQKNANTNKEVVGSSERLAELSDVLKGIVGQLVFMIEGKETLSESNTSHKELHTQNQEAA